MMEPKIDVYDDFASQYAEMVAAREEAGIEHEPIMPRFLKILVSQQDCSCNIW